MSTYSPCNAPPAGPLADATRSLPDTAPADPGRTDLVRAWLKHCGVAAPQDLDLSTLMAIHAFMRDGLRPLG